MAFKHWLRSDPRPDLRPGRLRRWTRAIPWSEVIEVAHITAGWALVTWGLMAAADGDFVSAVWRISAGLYLLSWVGWSYLREVFSVGIYLAPALAPDEDDG